MSIAIRGVTVSTRSDVLGSTNSVRGARGMELRTKGAWLWRTGSGRLEIHLTVIYFPHHSNGSNFEGLCVALEQGHGPWEGKRGNELDHDVIRPRLTLRCDSGL